MQILRSSTPCDAGISQQAAAGVHLNYEYALALSYNAFERHPPQRIRNPKAHGDGSDSERTRRARTDWQGCWSVRDGAFRSLRGPDQAQAGTGTFNLVKAKLLPKNFAVVGVAFDDFEPRPISRPGNGLSACRRPRHRSLEMVHRAALLSTRRIRRSGHVFDSRHATRRGGQGTRHASQLPVLPGYGAKVLRPDCSATGQGGTVRPERMDAGGEW